MSSHGPHASRVKTGLIVAFSLLILASPASAKTIYVSDLHSSTSSDSLRAAFEDFGVVSSAKVVTDPETGKSRGFGFVEMPNDHEAQEAIADLNESNFEHSRILVKAVGPRESSGSRPDGGGFGGNRPGASGGFGSGSTGNRPGGPGGIGGGGRPASQAPAPAAKPADTAPVVPPETTPKAPEPTVAPTPQVPLVDDASDETPDAEAEPLEGTPDLADESETSVGDDEDDVIDDEGEAEEEEETVEEAEEDGAMADQESGDDMIDDAAEVSEDDSGQSSGGDEATDFEVGDAVEDDQVEDSSESDEPEDTAE